MSRQLACLRHISWVAAVVMLALQPIARASGDDVLALIDSDLMAQEAMLAEFGMEETIIEEGAIIIRQGAEAYPKFLVRKEEARPFAFCEDHYYAPPPIVVRRIGLRVTVNGAGMPFLQWPYIKPKWDDPGPPPPLGPLVNDAEGRLPRDVDAYWMQKELYLKKNFDYDTACVMFWDCLQESSQLSGGQWIIKGPPRELAHFGSYVLYSKQWDKTYNMGILHYFPPPDIALREEAAKNEYQSAIGVCSNPFAVVFIAPNKWGAGYFLNQSDHVADFKILISDIPKQDKLEQLPRYHDLSLMRVIHPCPELHERVEQTILRATELREHDERRMMPWTGGTSALALE